MKRKIFKVGLIALIVSLTMTTGVFAQADIVTKEEVIDVTLVSGGYDLQTASVDSFGEITITQNVEKHSTGFSDDFTVKDLRGLDENWELTVSATSLQSLDNPDHVFENILEISGLETIERVGESHYQDVPTIGIDQSTVLDDGDVLIARSNGHGAGEFSLSFPEDSIHLTVGPGLKSGTYESTLSWNLASVPTN